MSKAKPQRYREGSLYQRASDGLWIGTLEAGYYPNGGRRRITVSAKTEAKARSKLRDRRLQLEREGHTGVSERTTIKAWADEWLPMVERTLAPNAYTATASAVRRWIVPTIGHRRFAMLTPGDVRAVANAQRAAGRTSSTQRRTHSVLMSLLKAAQGEGHPVPARVLAVKAPAANANDRTDVPAADAKKMLYHSEQTGGRTARWLAAFTQGIRQGEALGLRWDAIDFDTEEIAVSWQLQTLRYRKPRDRSSGFRVPDRYEAIQLDGPYHLVRPKSETSWRVIPMIPIMREALLRWRDAAPDSPHGLVFPDTDGRPLSYKDDDAAWYALQEACGVAHPSGRRYTIHETRHTAAQLLLEAGIDPAIITAILGHSTIVTSRLYMHAKTTHTRDALLRSSSRLELEGLFSRP